MRHSKCLCADSAFAIGKIALVFQVTAVPFTPAKPRKFTGGKFLPQPVGGIGVVGGGGHTVYKLGINF